MMRTRLLLGTLALLVAAPVAAGPPWIAIEYPANPHHPSTRDAVLLVRTYHHSLAMAVPVRGTAEGLVAGKRLTRQLDLRPTNMPGVYALRSELPRTGTWVLAITIEQGENDAATALVTLDGHGGIAHVEVPANRNPEGWVVPRQVKPADIDRALQVATLASAADARAGTAEPQAVRSGPGRGVTLAGVLGLPLLVGLLARRRRRI